MSKQMTLEEYVALAEELAKENGGLLPPNSVLVGSKYTALVSKILRHRELFEHLLPRLYNGKDKAKYAFMSENLDKSDEELMDLTGASRSTIRKWRIEIREEKGLNDKPMAPPDAAFLDVAKFVEDNLPGEWRLNLSIDESGTFIELVEPSGKTPKVRYAEDLDLASSVVMHVNFARKKAGLPGVEWEAWNDQD